MLLVQCRNGHKLKVRSTLAGRAIRCPRCQAVVRVPEAPTENEPEAEPQSTPPDDAWDDSESEGDPSEDYQSDGSDWFQGSPKKSTSGLPPASRKSAGGRRGASKSATTSGSGSIQDGPSMRAVWGLIAAAAGTMTILTAILVWALTGRSAGVIRVLPIPCQNRSSLSRQTMAQSFSAEAFRFWSTKLSCTGSPATTISGRAV